jgi:5-methylcytosine-specific restriction endonuclease McrA
MEERFKDDMNWDNYPTWEVDHIIPLSKEGEHNVNNLQPLWKLENKSKYNKIL